MASFTGVRTACSHGTTGTSTFANSSARPARNAEEPGVVARKCTRKSS
ncbi:hypothetical protein [Streptomyces albicerus]|nr:hypothetical protein [Streptomyces albicerus]